MLMLHLPDLPFHVEYNYEDEYCPISMILFLVCMFINNTKCASMFYLHNKHVEFVY